MAGKRNGCKAERGQQMLQRGIQSMELIANKARESSAMVHPAEVNSQRITAGTASDPLHSCKVRSRSHYRGVHVSVQPFSLQRTFFRRSGGASSSSREWGLEA
ncbi:hypothetical protein MPTK1_6g13650 [Marchantia polymorpha subsp. ruderalis]|uniref:Uncharacterized protein n=2 Tax=Marchantia polymorpha TaxID=3197 RepID=A0AAF6BRQ2_MARPO|nr:hypothetical protein MARPO_0047s0016 [Marchantia polymorpha]BBN14686.1 hypothetical protein Mp_6g13650 [Marchantia polymorpha subsp. ruderalis]|eukprot:PTQ39024.1 hypothetical protein MARPO_0047s0016 [Marchantia polymorpha]